VILGISRKLRAVIISKTRFFTACTFSAKFSGSS
jgi:hypothetical protein